jgi:hypothetical protein
MMMWDFDLFFVKHFRSSKEEIHLKILQATPLEPMRFAELGAGIIPKILKFLGLIQSCSGNRIFVRPGTLHDRCVLPQNSPSGPLEQPRIAQKGENGTKTLFVHRPHH